MASLSGSLFFVRRVRFVPSLFALTDAFFAPVLLAQSTSKQQKIFYDG
jgi:hypothetical protein